MTGLALYRSDRFSEADGALRKTLELEPGWDSQVLIWLVLAMTDHRLGRHDDARYWSDRSELWVKERLTDRPGGTVRGIPENWHWRDGVLLHLLRREVRAVLSQPVLDLPDHVFDEPSSAGFTTAP